MTSRDTVKHLCRSIITRLDNQKIIVVHPTHRLEVIDHLAEGIGSFILTEEDLRLKTIQKMGANSDRLADSTFTESDQYRAARAVVRKTFGEDELRGLYYQINIREIAQRINEFLMSDELIEDVFETDDKIEKFVIDTIKNFKPDELH